VYVNGQKVPKKTLAPGDIIRVGNTEAVFKRE
jgi:pSer/pThr/pTyr-binding forkhead associated (FHA) protein